MGRSAARSGCRSHLLTRHRAAYRRRHAQQQGAAAAAYSYDSSAAQAAGGGGYGLHGQAAAGYYQQAPAYYA